MLAGPVEGVMKRGRGGTTGGFATSALALGCTAGVLKRLAGEAERRPELVSSCRAFEAERESLSRDLRNAVAGHDEPGVDAETIRRRAKYFRSQRTEARLGGEEGG